MSKGGIYTDGFAKGTLTAPASADTKGAWTELIASTSFDAHFVIFSYMQGYYSQPRVYLMDLGIGGSGSEEVFVADMCAANGSPNYVRQYMVQTYAMPLYIPKGSRITGRYQCNTTDYLNVQLNLYSSYMGFGRGLAGVDTLGAATGDTGGTVVDSGGVANTYGSWVEFTSSSSRAYKGIMVGQPNNRNTGRSSYQWVSQVGVGGSGSEEVIIDNHGFNCRADDDDPTPRVSPFMSVHIPSGSRISVRSKCNGTDSPDRLLDIILYLFY